MWSRARLLLTDPRMITVWVFTTFLIIVFSVVSARPWNDTAVEETTKNLQECKYFNQLDERQILSTELEDINIKECVDKIWEKLQRQERKTKRQERRKRRKNKSLVGKGGRKGRKGRRGRKGRNGRRKNKGRRPETRSGSTPSGERRKRQRRQRKMFLEQEEFRKWKRKISVANLLSEPVAQDAINDLWTGLIAKRPEFREIYLDMHSNQDPHHIQHQNKPESTSSSSSTESSSLSSSSSDETSTLSSTIAAS